MDKFFASIFMILLVLFMVFIGPAMLVWGTGLLINGDAPALTFWNWLGGFLVLLVLKADATSK